MKRKRKRRVMQWQAGRLGKSWRVNPGCYLGVGDGETGRFVGWGWVKEALRSCPLE